jgi:uncharacterized membrane protein YgcG
MNFLRSRRFSASSKDKNNLQTFVKKRGSSLEMLNDATIQWSGWIKKAGENHNNWLDNWKDRYAKVFYSDSNKFSTILSYFATDAVGAKEKGRLKLSETITYYCQELNKLPTIFLVLPKRTWIFSFQTIVLLDNFVTNCLSGIRQGVQVKEGWLSLSKKKRYIVVLDTGIVLVFRQENKVGYETCYDITQTSNIDSDSTNVDQHDLMLTFNEYERSLYKLEMKKKEQNYLEESIEKLHKALTKKRKKLNATLQRQQEPDYVITKVDQEEREEAETKYAKYANKMETKQLQMNRLNCEIKRLEQAIVDSKGKQTVVHVWSMLTMKDSGFAGYLLGPKAELSSWLMALEDCRHLSSSGRGRANSAGANKGSNKGDSSGGNGRNSAMGSISGGGGGGSSSCGGHSRNNSASATISGGSGITKRSSHVSRRKKKHHKREEEEVVKDPITQVVAEEEMVVEESVRREKKKIPEVLPEGWASAEAVHPKNKNKQAYFFRQGTVDGKSATWEMPTESFEEHKQQQEKSISEKEMRRMSFEGKKLLQAMGLDDGGTSSSSKEASSSMYPGQKSTGSSKEAYDEAQKWSKDKSLRTMLLTVHQLSYLVSEPMLDPTVNDDPEVEMKKITKAYRKTIRLLHPDRTMRRNDVCEYEKSLASAIFTLLKSKMSS